jgi:prophage DNA circulation protein
MSWRDDLRRASWRGVEFDVLATESRFGRRTALHEYPFRDPVWIEDLGRGPRRMHLVGYLVGDDVVQQQDEMIEAAEQEGPGELVHPTLGLRQVSLVEFGTSARHELGRVVELSFVFIEGEQRLYPASAASTTDAVAEAADACDEASETSFLDSVKEAVQSGYDTVKDTVQSGMAAVKQAQATVRGWTSTASRLVGSATNAINSVGSVIPGVGNKLSRYLTGARSPLAKISQLNNTVSGGLSRLSRAQAAVSQGSEDVQKLAAKL